MCSFTREKISMRFMISALFLSLLLGNGCKDDPVSSQSDNSYTPLAVGDITQLVAAHDSSTVLLEIIGTTRRSDNATVYIGKWQYGRSGFDTSYYFLKGGYYVATELEPVTDDSLLTLNNPYREQRLAKSFPNDGDQWIHTPGSTDTTWWLAAELDSLDTPAGHFENVFAFHLGGFMTVYYGRAVGWLGTGTPFNLTSQLDFACTYKYVGGKTYGHLLPAKDPEGGEIIIEVAGMAFGAANHAAYFRPNGELNRYSF